MTRRNLFAALFVLAVMALTLRSVLHGSHMDDQYGLARIRLDSQVIYVKARTCKSGCSPAPWLSRNANRCKAPDPAADYTVNNSQVVYASTGNKLTLLGTRYTVVRPTGGDWIDLRFVSAESREADSLPLRSIMFGEHLPLRNVPTEEVTLGPCIHVFGRDW